MAEPIDELVKIRRDKLRKLEKSGHSGFPAWQGQWKKAGRLTAIRGHGGLIFADLVNQSGKYQISFKKDKLGKDWSTIELLDIGDFVAVNGDNYTTKAGEPTIDVSELTLLTKSLRPLPSEWYGLKDIEERYRQRYVDLLINPEVRQVFETRTKVVSLLREKLNKAGFMEVETPILQSIYGGATAKPFTTHHNALDIDLYLRISDELYLKRLIVGGLEKIYELGQDFRNEGIDRQHNPEFTMLEFYWAYANYEDLMKFTEKLLSEVAKEITGSYKVTWRGKTYDLTPPWSRVTYRDQLRKDSGIDINVADTEEKLLKELKAKHIKVDLDGVVGFGALLDTIYKKVSRTNIVGPIFLIDHPVALVPLAKRKAEDLTKSATFQLLIGGEEFIKAYNELNDPDDQKARWLEEMKLAKEGLEEHQVLDEDYIRALEYGMPPTAGWGLGIDRFVAFLTDQHTLKDTILFPTLRPEKTFSQAVTANIQKPKTVDYVGKTQNEIFYISDNVRNQFPGMKAAVVIINNIDVHRGSKELEKFKEKIVGKMGNITLEDIDKLPTVIAYRKIFKEFGVDWKSRHPSADALLRRIAQGKGIYNINTAVDSYNLAVLDSKIALGAFDLSKVSLPVTIRLAKEGEGVTLLGETELAKIDDGEMVYSDTQRVMTLDLNYRDCDFTKVTTETRNLILFADGTPEISSEDVMAGLEKGIEYITRFCGGVVKTKFIAQ